MSQYLRKCSLLVSDDAGDGVDLSRLHVTFEIAKADASTPNTATIKVYNLSNSLANKVRSEFTRCVLQAGYEDSFGLIFVGTIKQTRLGRENGVDSYVEITAADGDEAHNFAVVNQTLVAGASQADQMNAAIQPMAQYQITKGHIGDTGQATLPRGKVMYGPSRRYLRQSAEASGTTWSIQNGKVNVIPLTSVLPGDAIVLTPATGMIGTPEQTEDGISVQCLINPTLRVGGLVRLDVDTVLVAPIGEKESTDPAPLSPNGLYRILTLGYSGDTRGDDWYANLVCLSADPSAPIGKEVSPQ